MTQDPPDRPSWLPAEPARPAEPPAATFTPPPPPAAPVTPPPAPWRQPQRPVRFWESTLAPIGALGLIAVLAAAFFGYQHLQPADDSTPVVSAASMQLAYRAAQVHRFAVTQELSALLVLPDGRQGRAYSSTTAVEDFRVISVTRDGTATIGVRLESLRGDFDGIPVAFDAAEAKEMVVVITRDGKIVSGGTETTLGGNAETQDPGGDLFSSILPNRDVHVGDAWSSSFRRPNPMGSGDMTYTTNSTLLRLDGINGQQAAVVQSDYTLPIDELLNIRQIEQLSGGDGSDVPAAATVKYVGSSTGRIVSYVGTDSRQLLSAVGTSDFQFDMTFNGLPAGAQYQDLKGTFHFGGHLQTSLEGLAANPSA